LEINDLYNQIIIENSRADWNRHKVDNATVSLEGVNPSCGDDIILDLLIEDGIIEDAGFHGDGCAISRASASIMIDLVKGKTVEEAKELMNLFFGMVKGEITDEEKIQQLEEAAALQGVSRMPARVKCAVLAWHTLEEALGKNA
jgi:nitrogen fixation NifU-like protein